MNTDNKKAIYVKPDMELIELDAEHSMMMSGSDASNPGADDDYTPPPSTNSIWGR